MRIMGIDYGDARTGLAVSDAMNILVGEAWTVNQWDANTLADEIIRHAESSDLCWGFLRTWTAPRAQELKNAASLQPFSPAKPTFRSSCGMSAAAA